nr:dynein regulatory complex subunit 7 isoform X2 [Nothobranchius furzeri]
MGTAELNVAQEKAEISEEEEMEKKRQELKQTDQKEAPTNCWVSDHQELHPESYRINSPAETRLVTLAENFQLQYSRQYPDRRPLLLCPLNECGVRKFVSTTIRPSPTGRCDLQTWQGCAALVADLLMLEPLDPPTELPSELFSPTSVLRRQTGTCFDFATLLCSLLLGISYDAYCVSGYADRQVCLLDRSQERCPLLDTQKFVSTTIRPTPTGRCDLQTWQGCAALVADLPVSEQKQTENKYGLRRPRNRSRHILKQQEEKSHEAAAQKREPGEEVERPPSVHSLHGNWVHCWVLVLSGRSNVQENFFIDPLTGNSFPTDHQRFLGIESVWNHRSYYVNRQVCSSGCKAAPPRVFEMPRSWVGSIAISEKDQVRRWPDGKKVTRFRKANLEEFVPGVNADGLVTRLTTYRDPSCSEVAMVKEWYSNSRDHLEEKEINKLDGCISERFSPNKHTEILFYRRKSLPSGAEQEVEFSCRRTDHLVRRVMLPREVVDYFQDRIDFLYYRRICFNEQLDSLPHESDVLTIVERFHRNTIKPANEDVAQREFLVSLNRIELTFHLMDHHLIPSKMSFRMLKAHERFRPDQVSIFQVDESVRPLTSMTQLRMLTDLLDELEQLFQTVKDVLSEVSKITNFIEQRQEEEEEELSSEESGSTRSDGISPDVLEQEDPELQDVQDDSSS